MKGIWEEHLKTLLFAALLLSSPALADATDDYAACLIGQSAVELHKGAKDALDAQEAAYKVCKAPEMEENEAEGLSDFVNVSVEKLAAR